ncbi:MAG TPA: ABC transporter substrate-binding protein [Gaiellaceae bacterium]|jgi:NitT/TauT family transport system substrate-binding protein|nr:ABC transporter substrate-binding protein [Gaiellaceae bacterium]
MGRKHWVIAGLAAAVLLSVGMGTAAAKPQARKLDNVTLQLKWVTQSQFAGYYAAVTNGYYKDFGLNVTLKVGGPSITPETVVASGQAQIGVDWVPSLLATRDTGTSLVSIAQMFSKSGMTEISFKSSGITSVAKMKGKKVGVWCCGNQFELFAALTKNGIDPNNKSDITIFNQPFTMTDFLSHRIAAAAAMTYNELAQVLESKNPATGKLYTLKDLNVLPMQKQGTGMLEDNLFTTQSWLNGHRDIAMRFIAASERGWIYCRDHVQQCTDIVVKNGTALPAGHQLWQMNEINKLIWPSKLGIGITDPAAFKTTAAIALKYKVIKKAASAKAYDPAIEKAALQYLKNHVKGVDVLGKSYKPISVTLQAGGK